MKGIDISQHNGQINFDDVVNEIDFAILRAGFGVSYLPDKQKDKMFNTYYDGLNGKKPLGAYYFTYANKVGDGRKEAENCLKYIDGRNFDLPIYYDLEDDDGHHRVPKGIVNTIAREFVDTIKASGYKPGIYCNLNWAKNYIDLSLFKDCSIWIAMYGSNTGNIPSTKPSVNYNIWQYTSNGRVAGINGRVDMNISDDIPTPTPTPTPSGDKQIREIQEWLNNNYNTGIKVDGLYGKETKKALVKGLQTELNKQYNAGLVVDGIFGAKTKAKCPNVKKGARGNITRTIQSMLYCLGFNPNGIDGIFGDRTELEVRKFQADNRLAIDGIVGKNTFEKLFK